MVIQMLFICQTYSHSELNVGSFVPTVSRLASSHDFTTRTKSYTYKDDQNHSRSYIYYS